MNGLFLRLLDFLSPPLIFPMPLILGLLGGFSFFYWLSFMRKEREFSVVISGVFLAIAVSTPVASALLYSFTQYNDFKPILSWIILAVIGFLLAIKSERYLLGKIEVQLQSKTIESQLERSKKTDVRDIEKILPKAQEAYDPELYFKDDEWFLGLNEKKEPIYFKKKDLPHIQVCGTSGAGKGVFLGSISAQCIKKGEAVFIIDPKDDEWFPHVAKKVTSDSKSEYHFINLKKNEYQFNLFEDANSEEIEELFLAGFELGDRGEAADFYKLGDRKAAKAVAELAKNGDTPLSLFHKSFKNLGKDCEGFLGKFEELVDVRAISAKKGLSLKKVVENGGLVYFVGSTRNVKIMRVQKMILVRLIQIAERRDRIETKPRKICVVLDELKYHLSRTAIEALGTARDKGLHVVLAHQSIEDLRDCPKDLDPLSVVGAIDENSALKLVYKILSPESAEFFARKTGKIQVDDEIRYIERSISLTNHIKPDVQVKQAERYLVDENMFLNLPRGCGVLIGDGQAKFIYTSPVLATKSSNALEIPVSEESEDADDSILQNIDFEKLE